MRVRTMHTQIVSIAFRSRKSVNVLVMSKISTSSRVLSLPEMDQVVLALWKEHDVFQKSLEQTKDDPPFIFYDGPPFATGLPHHGNLLASVIKDAIPRYWTMKGRYVQRRFGWDCHGLPIEHEIDKSLGLSAQEALQKLGVAGYNAECRRIVETYVNQWREIITRIGRWIDFDNDYKTMDLWYMESVWWVVKRLWDKGLIYYGHKVMPVSTALETPLSNFEATSNYQDVSDPSITVVFRLLDEDAYISAWTTTPWTLPSNLALCVRHDVEYVKVADQSGRTVYIAADRLAYYENSLSRDVIDRVTGMELVGRRYEPLFPYFKHEIQNGAFVVVSDDYVSTDEGTGIVHQAPAFGEDDYRIAQEKGISAFVCPVTMRGTFTAEIEDFENLHVKTADREIIRYLKDCGSLLEQNVIKHSYPFCYRSNTPLIYRAVPSWYVRVSEFRDRLVAANEHVRWVPEHIKHGRFGNWLSNAVDWAISRNRIWGTPLPIWKNNVTGNRKCVGSRQELAELSGVLADDLHREYVDHITFTVDGEEGTYHRVEEILDCWFESGSMPYAQQHYPFENQTFFEAGFPAEFVAEGLDQTRGWFYTLMVLSVALYDKPAFRNVIVNGLVLAEDGKKMSKSLRNYTPPDELMNFHGADALRLYLISSGLVRGEEQRFSDKNVREMTRRALIPWYNAFSFLKLYATIDAWTPEQSDVSKKTVMDEWILSKLQTLKSDIALEMEGYRLYNVVPKLFDYIENLTNWFIRLNRHRFYCESMTLDKNTAYFTLYTAVHELTLAMAPCAPFLAEHIYGELARLSGGKPDPISVHLCPYPVVDETLRQPSLEAAVERMQQVILLGRRKREKQKINLRTPLPRLIVIHEDADLLAEIKSLESYVKGELNVKEVDYDSEESNYVSLNAKPNFLLLGKRLGRRMESFKQRIESMSTQEINVFQEEGSITLDGELFSGDEILVFRAAKDGTNTVSNRMISIDLDCTPTEELLREGLAREVVHRIQQVRKDLGLEVFDRIDITYDGSPRIQKALDEHREYVRTEILAIGFDRGSECPYTLEVENEQFAFDIQKIC